MKYSMPFDAQMRVTPKHFFCSGRCVDVAVADINSPHKSEAPIHHNYFAMIPIIHSVSKLEDFYFVKRENFYACGFQPADHSSPNRTTSKIVIDKTNSYTLFCFPDKHTFNSSADFVVIVNVIFDVYKLLCCIKRLQY